MTLSMAIRGERAFIIAEVAQSHDGSLGQAHAFVHAAARTGVDAIKFQTHIAAAESTAGEPWRVKFSPEDDTRYDYWRRMEFTPEQWRGLAEHARDEGLVFLSSAFSREAIVLLEGLGMEAWKVASGEVTNHALIGLMARTGAPVLLSSGMSSLAELDAAVELIRSHGTEVVVLQCATAYPCPPEQVGLNMIDVFRERYGCAVGLSDHSATIYPSLAAVTRGASFIEVHLTLSRDMFGPDVPASLTTDELAQLVTGVRFIESMLASPVDKDALAAEMEPMRRMFGKSVVARRDLNAGHVITVEDLATKKPGTGIPANEAPMLIGRVLCSPVAADDLLSEHHLEPPA